jgi:phospholipase C
MSNVARGKDYPVKHLERTHVPNPHWDPDHSAAATDLQIGDRRMDGFAESFARTLESRKVSDPPPDPGMVLGYFNGDDLPVYDHLASEFCACDCWHSSVPGATWPNRLYAVAGAADGSRDDKPKPPPIYDKKSFVRHLDAAGVRWRWYTYDVGTLRCIDDEYLLGHHDRFAYVDKPKLPWATALEEELIVDEDSASFVEDAQRGNLASVSWIDPNFKDVNLAHTQTNDDHPPSDVQDGQELVFLVYNALAAGPKWNSTLLLVLYDEHGGFFDHVSPPDAPDDDPVLRPLRDPRPGTHRLPVGRAGIGLAHAVRPHVDHQDHPHALLSGRTSPPKRTRVGDPLVRARAPPLHGQARHAGSRPHGATE